MIQNVLTFATSSAAGSRFVTLLERASGGRPNLLPVLTYHRVDEPGARPELDPSLISATPEAFDRQMRHLATHYRLVSMPELLEAYRTGNRLPRRSVMVTFDDAYGDFAEHAWPILKRYGLPVTLFVPTAFPDDRLRSFWWDRLYQAFHASTRRDELDTPLGRMPLATAAQRRRGCRRLREYVKTRPHGEAMGVVDRVTRELGGSQSRSSVLSWDELRRLASEGVTLGAHTRTHPLMNRVSLGEAAAEAAGSLEDLGRRIGSVLPIFAYPGGGFSREVVEALERAGFALAFATARGINDLEQADWLRLRRINVGRRTTLAVLQAQLLPWSAHLNRWF